MDLNIFFTMTNSGLVMNLNYNTDIYDELQIKNMAVHLENLGLSIFDSPDFAIDRLPYVSVQEERGLLSFAGPERPLPATTVSRLISKQHSGSPAILDTHRSVNYGELLSESNRVASLLWQLEQKPVIVGILMDRSATTAAAILGCWKAGHAYLPLDAESPFRRLKDVTSDAGMRILITTRSLLHFANDLQWSCRDLRAILCLDSDQIHGEIEPEKESMNQDMWESVGTRAADDIEAGGWINSFTGKPFSRKEMDEYAGNVYQKLKPYLTADTRVLEIGCASGITMFRLGPHVGYYKGTDMSATIIAANRERIREEGHSRVAVAQLYAHEIDQ
ncbi:MAG: AMP-binding protein, partial [Flammeovirgaceae bacterium]